MVERMNRQHVQTDGIICGTCVFFSCQLEFAASFSAISGSFNDGQNLAPQIFSRCRASFASANQVVCQLSYQLPARSPRQNFCQMLWLPRGSRDKLLPREAKGQMVTEAGTGKHVRKSFAGFFKEGLKVHCAFRFAARPGFIT